MPLCWLCRQAEAVSGEHGIKAADIAKVRGAISRKNPVLLTKPGERHLIGSARSKKIQYAQKSLCKPCNNARFQPFDQAWDAFFDRVHPLCLGASVRRTISTASIFTKRDDDLNLHLYFVKALGCALVDANTALDLSVLRTAILERQRVPTLRVLFRSLPPTKNLWKGRIWAETMHGVHVWNVQCAWDSGQLRSVVLFGRPRRGAWPRRAWHPDSTPTDIIIEPERRSRLNNGSKRAFGMPAT